MTLNVLDLGTLPYSDAWALQQKLADDVAAGGPNTVLLVTHPHVFTLGTMSDESNVLWDEGQRARLGVSLVYSDRGGDVTYHGPGQIVMYPVVKLPRKPGAMHAHVIEYLRRMERCVIAFLAEYGVTGISIPGYAGVWVETPGGEAKIAAMGVRVNVKGIATHGIALNVNTDLRYFSGIIPCGIPDKGVTSLHALLGRPVNELYARARLVRCFKDIMADFLETGGNR
jgi:lipoyl(octanoyl) transferase